MTDRQILDAHALVWYLEGNPRLGAQAKACIDDPSAVLILPIIALAEAAWVIEHRRSSIPSVTTLLERVQADPRISVASLTLDILALSLTLQPLPELHDRLIVATALSIRNSGVSVAILTRDGAITSADIVQCIW